MAVNYCNSIYHKANFHKSLSLRPHLLEVIFVLLAIQSIVRSYQIIQIKIQRFPFILESLRFLSLYTFFWTWCFRILPTCLTSRSNFSIVFYLLSSCTTFDSALLHFCLPFSFIIFLFVYPFWSTLCLLRNAIITDGQRLWWSLCPVNWIRNSDVHVHDGFGALEVAQI